MDIEHKSLKDVQTSDDTSVYISQSNCYNIIRPIYMYTALRDHVFATTVDNLKEFTEIHQIIFHYMNNNIIIHVTRVHTWHLKLHQYIRILGANNIIFANFIAH